MNEANYGEAAVEVLDILNHTRKEDVDKIPQSFIEFLINISNKNYKVDFNHEYPISSFNLKQQTKELLGFIYITWWSTNEERNKYKKLIQEQNEQKEEIKEEYNPEDIFKNRKQKNEILQNKDTWSIVEYKKQNIFKRIFNKILNFFGIEIERN